jgi:transposase
LLLAQGYAWAAVAAVLFTAPDTIARWKRRYEEGGVAAVLPRPESCS